MMCPQMYEVPIPFNKKHEYLRFAFTKQRDKSKFHM